MLHNIDFNIDFITNVKNDLLLKTVVSTSV